MSRRFAANNTLSRSVWIMLAVFVVVFCGPVKRLIEIRFEGDYAAAKSPDKKLRTCYRDKRDSAPTVNIVSYKSPDSGHDVSIVPALYIVSFPSPGLLASPTLVSKLVTRENVPLYLHFRNLRI